MKKFLKLFLLSAVILLFASSMALARTADNIQLISANKVAARGETQYQFVIRNIENTSHRYRLSTTLLPTDYQAVFYLENKQKAAVDVPANDSRSLALKIEAPEKASAGTFFFEVSLIRDDGISEILPLSLTVNKDFALSIVSQAQGLSVLSGQSIGFDVAVANTGSKAIQDVQLKFELPHKWIAQAVTPEQLAIDPGAQGSFHIELLVPVSQAAGNEEIKVAALSGSIESSPTAIPVQVQKNPGYLIWAVVLVLLAGAGTVFYFKKHGRR